MLAVHYDDAQEPRNPEKEPSVKPQVLATWAGRLGAELSQFGDYVTRKKEVLESFKEAKVETVDGNKLIQDIAKEIKVMMDLKIRAVERIMDTAENSALNSHIEETVPPEYQYYNAKMLRQPGQKGANGTRELLLTPNSHFFDIPVNTSVSSVHVPTNVYDRSKEVIHAIKWSENLDSIFLSNYKIDPSLSWQYFGSSTGFMRQFPAMEWKQDPVDLYDCRTRSWYIEAATSPKDILILVDNSGSMMGQRKEIARHVVNNILDTLGNNDYVNIMTFVNDTEEVVPCFKERLVQANLANIRELKNGMQKMQKAKNIANFTIALTRAFDILQYYRETRQGAACNQAIMLITDGVPYNYKEIFEDYNWQNLPYMPVRVFTYLIGKEVADVREVKWMACANRGYYVHLSTLAEVREQVLQYIPVMARPLVLQKNDHPVIWTPVYADITDPKMTDWLWEEKECAEQKQRSMSFRKDRFKFMRQEEIDRRYVQKLKMIQEQNTGDFHKYKLMTSVSMPVYDRRENATNVAYLLGVAGTDVPNSDIQRLMMPHLLGVNAYAFVVTNNGYILIHPDLRPVFQGILKPSYNSVDMTDVELLDDGRGPRDFNPSLLSFRESVINQKTGNIVQQVKQHYDSMKRVTRGRRHYYYTGINGTPFSLVMSLPDGYGFYRVDATEETRRSHAKGKSVLDYFQGKNWKVHPEWYYCKYHFENSYSRTFKTPEDEVLHFLDRTYQPGWKWPLKRNPSPPEHECDRKLFLSLIFDAMVTEWFTNNVSTASAEEKGKEFKQRFGLTLVFMATRSGLTRWQDFPNTPGTDEATSQPHFSELHNRAIDEIWYKRAVEQYFVDPRSYVYSVPFDNGSDAQNKNDTLVTASHAVFLPPDSKRQAPVAVVGFQFQHSALYNLFMNITSTCNGLKTCRTCDDEEIDCYVLDSNAYIIISEDKQDTGKFFGEIRGNIMESLVAETIYRRVHIYDYQAVCFRGEVLDPSSSVKLNTPAQYFGWLINWFLSNILWLLVQANLQWLGSFAYTFTADDSNDVYPENYNDGGPEPTVIGGMPEINSKSTVMAQVMINRTRPQPCDMEVDLYQLEPESKRNPPPEDPTGHRCDTRPYWVQSIQYTNLLLVVVNTLCRQPERPMNVIPSEIYYNESLSCYKINRSKLTRRRPEKCINQHEREEYITLCGRGFICLPNTLLLCGLASFIFFRLFHHHLQL